MSLSRHRKEDSSSIGRDLSPYSTYALRDNVLTEVESETLHSPYGFTESLAGGSDAPEDKDISFSEKSSVISDILSRDTSSLDQFRSPTDILTGDHPPSKFFDNRSHYVRTPKTTLVIQERESFL